MKIGSVVVSGDGDKIYTKKFDIEITFGEDVNIEFKSEKINFNTNGKNITIGTFTNFGNMVKKLENCNPYFVATFFQAALSAYSHKGKIKTGFSFHFFNFMDNKYSENPKFEFNESVAHEYVLAYFNQLTWAISKMKVTNVQRSN
jgi:hypothetical protein